MSDTPTIDTFWIGGATTWTKSPTPGLRTLEVHSDSQSHLGPAQSASGNPTFATILPNGNMAVVNELSDGQVSIYSLRGSRASLLGSARTRSADPTHLAASPDGTAVFVANYGGGALTVHRVSPLDIRPASLICQYEGTGPTERQTQPHPHQVIVVENRGIVLVPDLGMDVIHIHKISDLLENNPKHWDIALEPGCGPRHLVVSGHLAIVACELDNSVRVIDLENCTQVAYATPTKHKDSFPSAITLTESGHILIGNRGPDTIGILRWDSVANQLEYVDEFPCGGEHPRDFAMTKDQKHLVVANLYSNTLSVLKYAPEIPSLGIVDTVSSPSPTCAIRVH